jgi:solute:Na+ symporter, SSS family
MFNLRKGMIMQFGILDILIFLAFVTAVVTTGLIKSRNEKTGEDYFLAGRGLKWWLIGFSLIAANISTEQFVGMSGNAACHVGIAIASYEWMAAITLIVVAFIFLPYFLRAGIFTIPEFLEYRFEGTARVIMALETILIYLVLLGSVTYSGALTIGTLANKMGYNVTLLQGSLVIGVIAMLYVTTGGLKACAWADLIQGSALILGGGFVMWFAFTKLGAATELGTIAKTGAVSIIPMNSGTGAFERFMDLNRGRMNMFLPADDKILPWTALMLGLWIPNFYYWGLNQYITQRTLGSASLQQGQKGIVFAAFLKLIIPFVIVVPGMIAFNLFYKDMQKATVGDNTPIIAKYLKANPQTKFVKEAANPTEADIKGLPSGSYMLAVYQTQSEISALKTENPFVLPITRAELDATKPAQYTVFKSDDQSWRSTNKDLAVEIDEYNKTTEEKAKTAGAIVTTEKPIAYKYDTALAQLLGNVLPQQVGIVGFVLAALLGAVVSSLAALLNAGSTIFAMDIFKKLMAPKASSGTVVFVGRVCVVVMAVISMIVSPNLGNPNLRNSIFTIIQESQGFISPGILAAFVFGLVVRKAPRMVGAASLITNIIGYYVFMKYISDVQFLNRMAICFALCVAVMTIITIIKPLPQPVEFRKLSNIDLTPNKNALSMGIIVVILTLVLYVIFSPLVLAK